ncbi:MULTISPECIES: KilA-N domain-containing protein [Cupriavidus]
MTRLVPLDYQCQSVRFTDDGWINATEVAARFGKRLDNWLRSSDTQDYIAALADTLKSLNSGDLIRTRRGNNGGTWLHPKLAVSLARWCDARFAVWCDARIDDLLRGPGLDDWRARRADAAVAFRAMTEAVLMSRQLDGKTAETHHYSNEARLVAWALTGEFATIDRSTLSDAQLGHLAVLETRNAFLLARGLEYAERKALLAVYAVEIGMAQQVPALDATHQVRRLPQDAHYVA